MPDEFTPMQAAATAARVAAGDKEAYAELVDTYQDRVRALVAGWCRSSEEIEETCHLTFVQAFRNIAAFDPRRGSFLTWLLRIARNCLLAEIRRRRNEGQHAARYLQRAAETGIDHRRLEAARAALEKCLEELTAKEQQLVEDRYTRQTTSEEIASALQKTAGAVRMNLQRIRERLRSCVERRLAESEA